MTRLEHMLERETFKPYQEKAEVREERANQLSLFPDMPVNDLDDVQSFVIIKEKKVAFLRNEYWQSSLASWSLKNNWDIGEHLSTFNRNIQFIKTTKQRLLNETFTIIIPQPVSQPMHRKNLNSYWEHWIDI